MPRPVPASPPGAMYGMPGIEVDGNDVLAVHEAAAEAVQRARNGAGPTLLECRTYRTRPHAEGMGDYTYRTREEVEIWKERCPVLYLRGLLEDEGMVEQAELAAIEAEVAAVVEDAQQFAESSPWPERRVGHPIRVRRVARDRADTRRNHET